MSAACLPSPKSKILRSQSSLTPMLLGFRSWGRVGGGEGGRREGKIKGQREGEEQEEEGMRKK